MLATRSDVRAPMRRLIPGRERSLLVCRLVVYNVYDMVAALAMSLFSAHDVVVYRLVLGLMYPLLL